MVDKSRQNSTFYELDTKRQKAIVMLFEDKLSDEEIAKSVNRSRATLSKWKKEPKFQIAMEEYRRIAVDDFVPDAIKQLKKLVLYGQSEMVKFQSIMAILNLSGYGTMEENPEVTQAKIRKLNAEADIAESKAKLMNDDRVSLETKIVIGEFEDE